jgi:hypothetical protein
MKIDFSLLLIITFASHFGTIQVFAQKRAKPREVILIEFFAPNDKEANRIELKINRTSKEINGMGGGRGSGCGECTPEQIAAQPSNYLFTARAFRMGKDKANVGFEIEIEEECKARKIFTVYRNRETKLQLNCGVSLTAYYGLETEEMN